MSRRFVSKALFRSLLSAHVFLLAGATPALAAKKRVTFPATKGEREFVVEYDDGKLSAESCEKPGKCAGEKVEFEIPKDVDRLAFSSEILSLRGGKRLLQVSFGKERTYELLLAPSESGPPRLVLKGYSGGPKDAKIEISDPKEATLYVTRPSAKTLCGKKLVGSAKRYDPTSGEFVDTRFSPLSADERRKAGALVVESLPEPFRVADHTLVALSAETSSDDASFLFDGGFSSGSVSPWASATLNVSGLDALVFHKSEGEKSGAFFVAGDKVFSVALPREAGAFRVALPALAKDACFGLVADAGSGLLGEVSGLAVPSIGSDAPSIVRALVGETREMAERALRLVVSSSEADLALSGAYAKLEPAERARLLAALEKAPEPALVFTLEKAISAGSPAESARAEKILEVRADYFRPLLVRAFSKSAPTDEARFARLLRTYAPSEFLGVVVPKLAEKSPVRRAKLRDLISTVAEKDVFAAEIRGFLASDATSRTVKIELLRAVGDKARALGPEAVRALAEIVGKETFAERMQILPAWLALAPLDPGLTKLLGERAREKTGREQAAFLASLFEYGSERNLAPESLALAKAFATENLAHPEMRVRRTAILLLGRTGEKSVVSSIEKLGESDPWPGVREAALFAVPANETRGEEFLAKRLEKDETPRVRAAAARALEKGTREDSLAALREALADDDAPLVRARAAEALGRRCDVQSLGRLTDLARKLVVRGASEADLEVAWGALSALVTIHPADFDARVAPLLGSEVPGPLRGQIRMILERGSRHSCASGARAKK